MDLDQLARKRQAPILKRDNWEKWFKLLELYFGAKSVRFVIQQTMSEYAWIPRGQDYTSTPVSVASGGSAIDELTTGIGKMYTGKGKEKDVAGCWNIEKREKYEAAEAEVLYMISICIDETDEQFIEDFEGAKDKWNGLRAKYSKVRPQAARDQMKRITTFSLGDMTIDDAWTKLKELRRQVIAMDAKKKGTFTDENLFDYLLSGLPEEYATTCDVIDSQTNLDIPDKILILQKKEDRLPSKNTTALAAQQISSRSRRSHSRSSSDSDKSYRGCYLCGGKHGIRNCDHLPRVSKYIKKRLQDKDTSSPHQKSHDSTRKSSKHCDKSKSSKGKQKGRIDKGTKRAIRSAYLAGDYDSSSEDSGSDTAPESEEGDETAAISAEDIRKVPPSAWVADTACTSHMTDNPRLFRAPPKQFKRGIKVGGGRIFSTHKGTAEMRLPDGNSVLLSNVLLVPKLGVNLLSAKKVCLNPMVKGSFDLQSMWFHYGEELILKATVQGGVYLISWIKPGSSEVAYVANQPPKTVPLWTAVDKLYESKITTPSLPKPGLRRIYNYGLHNASESEDVASETESEASDQGQTDEKSTQKPSPAQVLKRYQKYHRRFGHIGAEKLRHLHKVTKLKEKILIPSEIPPCEVCRIAKMRNRVTKTLSPWKADKLAMASVDACGPLPKSLRGNRYFGQIVDSATRRVWSLCARTRDDLVVKLRAWKVRVEKDAGHSITSVRVDNAAELRSLLTDWANSEGIHYEPTVAHQHNQNGVAEKSIQTAENDARALLQDSGLPIEFWDESVEHGTYLRNRSMCGPKKNGVRHTPIGAYTGEPPEVDHIRPFGVKCYSWVNRESLPKHGRTDKLMVPGRVCVFMGYSEETTKQYKVYAPDLGYTIRSSVVDFVEDTIGGTIDLKIRGAYPQGTANTLLDRNPVGRPKETFTLVDLPPQSQLNNFKVVIPMAQQPQAESCPSFPEPDLGNSDQQIETEDLPEPGSRRSEQPKRLSNNLPVDRPVKKAKRVSLSDKLATSARGQQEYPSVRVEGDIPNKSPEPLLTPPVDKSLEAPPRHANENTPEQRYLPRKRKNPMDEEEKLSKLAAAMIAIYEALDQDDTEIALIAARFDLDIPIPRTYKEAVRDANYGKQWLDAIQEEILSLTANGTWTEEIQPDGANLVSTKWVFTVKTYPDGTLERFKARLVARGFSQVYGEDYTDTFAPTVRMDTMRIFLALVAAEDLECNHLDIKNAFTESSLKERIYLTPPAGVPVRDGYVLRVLRSLYGLKQSARDWNLLLRDYLVKIGYVQSLADPCLFTLPETKIMILVYVDDIICAAPTKEEIAGFYSKLQERFKSKNLGGISKVLGIRTTRNRKTKTIYLDQEQYLERVLKRYGITAEKHKAKKIPLADYSQLRPARPDDKRVDVTLYQQMIGHLMYAMVHTRPDIAFALGKLSQHLTDPAEHHMAALKNLMRYLRSTIRYRLKYSRGGNPRLVMHSDADWAGQRSDRKSTSGSVGLLCNCAVTWASKVQRSVATSSTESEYLSMSMTAKMSQWIAQVLRDMGYPEYIGRSPAQVDIRGREIASVDIRGDNQGAIALVKNPHLHERSKHIDICYHHIRDLAERGKITVTYIPTYEMIADGLTKPLQATAFARFKGFLGMDLSGANHASCKA
jgi:Reverse transcriptase (RNA-dependent DNA polymerase)/gag-polypeptide of LTR copia-type